MRLMTMLAGAAATTLLAACHRTPPSVLRAAPGALDAPAPDSFVVRFETTKGDIDLMLHRDWAPRGADRIHGLVRHGAYDGVRFFRAVPNFVVQFGLSGDPAISAELKDRRISDDSVRRSNVRGTLSFAAAGPNTRTAQLFINLKDNQRLDRLGFAVVGQVVAGMEVVDALYTGYGEGAPRGQGPTQDRIAKEGEAYLAADFPRLDQIRRARVVRSFTGKR
ncbi:MAG: peptidylprolyl isomerase [Gemmatimonadetes bacterium]|nr:peptidylprolyl isomerase [Gemmatimonadota bacterium]